MLQDQTDSNCSKNFHEHRRPLLFAEADEYRPLRKFLPKNCIPYDHDPNN